VKEGLPCWTFKVFFKKKTKQIADAEHDGTRELAMKQAKVLDYKVAKRFNINVTSALEVVYRKQAAAFRL
jgi:hypothetical protein